MAKKTSPNRKYTAEFKADVLRLVANGESILSVAQKMGIAAANRQRQHYSRLEGD